MPVVIYYVTFAAWLLLTVLWQFDQLRERSRLLRRVNALHILPIWTFFAPRPGMSDTHILYRDKIPGEAPTEWREVTLVEERRPIHWLWNPIKRLDKVAVDALSDIKMTKNKGDEAGIDEETLQQHVKLSKGYLILMNIVFSNPRITERSCARQFAVLEANLSTGERTMSPIFVSPFHAF